MSKDAYWFPHDSNAHGDKAIIRLKRKHGYEGVGIYWTIIELLREENDNSYEIPCESIDDLIYEYRFKQEIIDDLFTNDEDSLLQKNDKVFWSNSLKRRMKAMDERRQRKVEAGRKGGLSRAKAVPKQRQSKANKSKALKSNKKNTYSESVNQIWSHTPKKGKERSSLKELQSEWDKTNPKPEIEFVLKRLDDFCKSEDWQKDNGQYVKAIHLWVKARKWEVEITPHEQIQNNQKDFNTRLTPQEAKQKRQHEAITRAADRLRQGEL